MIRLTIACRSCLVQFRLVVPDKVLTNKGPQFCVYCGSQDVNPSQDTDRDYWEVLAESYGLPESILQMLYTSWVQSNEGHTKFKDYVEQTLKEAVEKNK